MHLRVNFRLAIILWMNSWNGRTVAMRHSLDWHSPRVSFSNWRESGAEHEVSRDLILHIEFTFALATVSFVSWASSEPLRWAQCAWARFQASVYVCKQVIFMCYRFAQHEHNAAWMPRKQMETRQRRMQRWSHAICVNRTASTQKW